MNLEEGLPVEIQLCFIQHLDAIDIFHIQLTCRHFYDLIEANGRLVWRRCLRRLSDRVGLFWPSFKDLTTASEFKRACTEELTLQQKFRDAETTGAPLQPRITEIRPPARLIGAEGGVTFEDLKLVDGGRFAVVSERSLDPGECGRLLLLDLTKSNGSLLVSELLVEDLVTTISLTVASDSRLYLLLLHRQDSLPPGFVPPTPSYNACCDVYRIVEIRYEETLDQFFMSIISRLSVVSDSGSGEYECAESYLDSDKAVLSSEEWSVLWNFHSNQYTGWAHTPFAGNHEYLASHDRTVFFVDSAGLHGFEAPPYRTIDKKDYVWTDTLSSPADASFLLRHDVAPRAPYSITPIRTHIARQPVDVGSALLYQVMAKDEEDFLMVDRYSFVFNGVPDGTRSLLDRVQSLKCPSPKKVDDYDLSPYLYLVRGKVMWALWDDLDSYDVEAAISCTSSSVASFLSPPSPTQTVLGDLGVIPLLKDNSDEDEGEDLVACRFDPDSGKALTLTWVDEDETSRCYIRYYDFTA